MTPEPTMLAANGWGAMPYPSCLIGGPTCPMIAAPAIEAGAEDQAIGGSIERLCR
jgi:hypothetical protein